MLSLGGFRVLGLGVQGLGCKSPTSSTAGLSSCRSVLKPSSAV